MIDNTETWRPISGYDGRYEVSDRGNVRATLKWNGRTLVPRIRVLTPRDNGCGYRRVVLVWPDGTSQERQVSHLVAGAFIENPDGLPEVMHVDGNRRNNTVRNLRWATRSDLVRAGVARRAPIDPPAPPASPEDPEGQDEQIPTTKDPDEWGSASGHKYVIANTHNLRWPTYSVRIRGVGYGTYPTLEMAVAARNEVMGW